MSATLKIKKENWTGEEVAVLLEEVEKSKPFLFETAPIHRDTDDFLKAIEISTLALEAASWPVAKNCRAVVSCTIGCIAYVRCDALCRSGTMDSNKSNMQTTFPTEVVLVNKFLISKVIEWIQPLNYKIIRKILFQNKSG